MKTQCKAASFCLLVAAAVLACRREPGALLAGAIALQLYALTQWQANWYEQLTLKSWSRVLSRRYQTSLAGMLCAMASMLLLVGYFVFS